MNQDKDVLVLLEPAGEKGTEINQGLVAEGRRISEHFGAGLSAVTIGESPEDPDFLKPCGLTKLYCLHGNGLSHYSGEIYSWAAAEALSRLPFVLLLMAHTDRGRELAPRIAFRLHTVAVTGCVDIRIRNQQIFYVRSVHGDQLEREISCAEWTRPVVSIQPEALPAGEAANSPPFQVLKIPIEIPRDLVGSRTDKIVAPDCRTMDIQHAERIVGAGSGCASAELLSLVEELSQLLEGSIAATRPMVDDGFVSRDRMIGKTGKTVAPELYLALGISGSTHHVAGVQRSKTILAVNRDPAAPILGASDAGFIGDLESLLPLLMARIRKYRDESV
jgi:electron transfer flavoprotein alpha subunit